MAISFVCPACRAVVTYEDHWAGARTPCKRCGADITVPAQSTASPEQIAAGEPPGLPPYPGISAPRFPDAQEGVRPGAPEQARDWEGRRRDLEGAPPEFERDYEALRVYPLAPGWNIVKIGLSLMYWGVVSIFIAILVYVAFALVAAGILAGGMGQANGPPLALLGVLAMVIIGAMAIAGIVYIIGQCLCCAVPPESGARGLAIGSVACLLLLIVLGVGFFCMSFTLVRRQVQPGPGMAFAPDAAAPLWLFFLAMLVLIGLYATGHTLFVLFVRRTASYFDNGPLVQSTVGYLVLYYVLMGLNLFLTLIQAVLRDPGVAPLFGCLGLIMLIVGLILLVWYLRLIAGTRDTINNALRFGRSAG